MEIKKSSKKPIKKRIYIYGNNFEFVDNFTHADEVIIIEKDAHIIQQCKEKNKPYHILKSQNYPKMKQSLTKEFEL